MLVSGTKTTRFINYYKDEKTSMDWVIMISLFAAGILWMLYIIKSYRNRNDYQTAIKSKDWQNDLRYNVNHSRVKHCFLAILMILFALLLVYIKFQNLE